MLQYFASAEVVNEGAAFHLEISPQLHLASRRVISVLLADTHRSIPILEIALRIDIDETH
jgi:hypothetical protein